MLGDARWADCELLGFDLETTGVDRFSDVAVSFALVTVERGVVTGTEAHLVDPEGRSFWRHRRARISTERARDEGMPLDDAVEVLADALIRASRRGVPVAGIKLDYDLTILDVQCRRLDGRGLGERGWAATCSTRSSSTGDSTSTARSQDPRPPLRPLRRRHPVRTRCSGRRGGLDRRPLGDEREVPELRGTDVGSCTSPRSSGTASGRRRSTSGVGARGASRSILATTSGPLRARSRLNEHHRDGARMEPCAHGRSSNPDPSTRDAQAR